MRVIPVIDVMGGQVVRAVGGRRSEYRPVQSRLTDSTEPVEVTRALIDYTGADTIYVADLDAIAEPYAHPTKELAESLSDTFPKTRIWIDCGKYPALLPIWERTRGWNLFNRWRRRRNLNAVFSSESMTSMDLIQAAANEFAVGAVVSLDFRGDRLLGKPKAWKYWSETDPSSVPALIGDLLSFTGAWYLIVLDLSRVGTGQGPGTEDRIKEFKVLFPDIEIYAAGGVRGWDDVKRLEATGADGVLVASALHDGALTFPRPTA